MDSNNTFCCVYNHRFYLAVNHSSFWKLQNLLTASRYQTVKNTQDIFLLNILSWQKTSKSSFSITQTKPSSHLPRLAASCSGLSIDSACSATETEQRVSSNYFWTGIWYLCVNKSFIYSIRTSSTYLILMWKGLVSDKSVTYTSIFCVRRSISKDSLWKPQRTASNWSVVASH